MSLILNKSKFITPKENKIIKSRSDAHKAAIDMVKSIAKEFGQQSKKSKPKKILFR